MKEYLLYNVKNDTHDRFLVVRDNKVLTWSTNLPHQYLDLVAFPRGAEYGWVFLSAPIFLNTASAFWFDAFKKGLKPLSELEFLLITGISFKQSLIEVEKYWQRQFGEEYKIEGSNDE